MIPILLALCVTADVARAQPLVPPPAPVAMPAPAPGGMALASPWLATGWDDGLAEVATYDLRQFRYGDLHPGSAVLIAVRETMDPARAVKSRSGAGLPVLKLHLTRTFTTGVYRYDQSSFQLVGQADGLIRRWLITSHEWCGAASKSWINGGPLRVASYFDGHGDLEQELDLGGDAVPEDSLWWWARSWVAAGMPDRAVRWVPSQIEARCVATTPVPGTITAAAGQGEDPQRGPVAATIVTVRIGQARHVLTLADDPGRTLLAWDHADGSQLRLRTLRRFAYWQHHDNTDRHAGDQP
jgi:hypothetical protein